LEKLLRLSAYQVLKGVDEKDGDIDEILNRANVIAESDMNVNVDVEGPDFWQNLLEPRDTGAADICAEAVCAMPDESETGECNDNADEDKDHEGTVSAGAANDDSLREWNQSELSKLRQLLFTYGWGRWSEAKSLCGLNQSVLDVKRAGRAVVFWLINATNDLEPFWFTLSLLESAYSTEFDPDFEMRKLSEAVDAEFMKKVVFLDSEFVMLMRLKPYWLMRFELAALVTVAVERANQTLSEIVVPILPWFPHVDWWTEHDDQCLIYGTWKYGLGLNWLLRADEAISFTNASLPGFRALSERLRKLADGIRNLCFISAKISKITASWSSTEKSKVLDQMLHGGVPLSPDGSLNWAKFRDIYGLADEADEEIEKLVNVIIKVAGNRRLDITDDTGEIKITVNNIERRFVDLTRLRRAFLKYDNEEMNKYFSFLPRCGNFPPSWTAQKEFLFFKQICERGFGVCGEILQMAAFEGIFAGDPPIFFTDDDLILQRLNYILNFIERARLESLHKPRRNISDITSG
jgi:hypothetical protein